MRRRNFLVAAAGSALATTALTASTASGTAPPTHRPAGAVPPDAQEAMLAAFDTYEVVAGMSPSHGVRDVDDFLISLIRNPRLPGIVQDIAVEGGNSLYQPTLDRYIAGENVPFTQVRQVWRNITQPGGGYSTFYEQLFPLVRRINQRLPDRKKLRVLACDPPIDWSKVNSAADLDAFLAERDTSIASVMEKEVLSKRRKALMFFGTAHTRHNGGAVRIYEQNYPGVTFTVTDHRGFAKDNDELERRMASWPVPSLTPIAGTWLGDLDSSYFSVPGGAPLDPGKGYPGIDGYLYCGPRDFLLHQPLSAGAILDTAFTAEREQRAAAVQAPPDAPWHPAVLFQQEEASSVFFYDGPPTS